MKKQARRPELPSTLLSEISASKTPSAAYGHATSNKSKKGGKKRSRKEERKDERAAKKMRRRAHFGHVEPAAPAKPSANTKKPDSAKVTAAIRKQVEQTSTSEQEKSATFAKSNPKLHSLLVKEGLVAPTSADGQRVHGGEEDEVTRYERLLGVAKKPNAGRKAIAEDGLDDLLDFSTAVGRRQPQMAPDHDDEDLTLDTDEDDDDNDDDDALDFEDDFADLDGGDQRDKLDLDIDGPSVQSEESDDELQSEADEESAPAPASTETGAYVPPHLRRQQSTVASSEHQADPRLVRQLQGLINRLSESNMDSLLVEIEKVYMTYSRHDVTSTLTKQILQLIMYRTSLLDSFVNVYAAFVTCISVGHGQEVAAHFVQELVESFLSRYAAASEQAADLASDLPSSKESINLIVLTAMLYNFRVISCVLVYDLVRLFMVNLRELDIELLMKMLKLAGAQMRTDDPDSLGVILSDLKQSTSGMQASEDGAGGSARLRFMLEAIYDLKSNKQRKGGYFQQFDDAALVKFIANFRKHRNAGAPQPLRVTLDDIRSAKSQGKWWLVGSAWVGNQVNAPAKSVVQEPSTTAKKRSTKDKDLDLVSLARAQSMNTDVRRNIFAAIVSSEDYIDAFERLLKLGLHEKQQREIVRVLVHCASNERNANPFYSMVAEKLCRHAHSFRITFQYVLWDFLKLSPTPALRKTVNVAKLYSHLFATQALLVSLLKGLEFTALTQHQVVFLRVLTVSMLQALPRQAIAQLFGPGGSPDAAWSDVRKGLKMFLRDYAEGGRKLLDLVPATDGKVFNAKLRSLSGALMGDGSAHSFL
ncbi:suppressor of glycerol defect [Sorochytrium milnesiophthora]